MAAKSYLNAADRPRRAPRAIEMDEADGTRAADDTQEAWGGRRGFARGE
jgi:hypothetical protein